MECAQTSARRSSVPEPRRSQIRCKATGSAQDRKPLSSSSWLIPPSPAAASPIRGRSGRSKWGKARRRCCSFGVHLLVTRCDVRDGGPLSLTRGTGPGSLASHSMAGDRGRSSVSHCPTPGCVGGLTRSDPGPQPCAQSGGQPRVLVDQPVHSRPADHWTADNRRARGGCPRRPQLQAAMGPEPVAAGGRLKSIRVRRLARRRGASR